jgi:uncharacterized protein YfbU (UPF0304 family)
MSLAERFLKDFEELPEDKKKEVIDFIEFLKMRDKNELGKLMDSIIDENQEAFTEIRQ